jgi:hypothetical protein
MDTAYIFCIALAAGLVVMGLIVRNSKPVKPPTVKDLVAWKRNVNTAWSRDER